jgi:hypothetical protein
VQGFMGRGEENERPDALLRHLKTIFVERLRT